MTDFKLTESKPKAIQFRGKLETGLITQDPTPERRWTAIWLPFDPHDAWPIHKNLRVRGTINGCPFRNTLVHPRTGGYLLLVKQALQKQAGIVPGSITQVLIEPDLEDRSVTPPPELTKLFKADRDVKKWFERLSYSMRKYICDAVAEPKSPDARQRRAEHWVECLMLSMEGEVEPPPILQIAFRRQPRARDGWYAMTPIQRRNTLIGIFMNKGPEARAKRAERAVADALRAANRTRNSSHEEVEDF